MNNFAFLQYVHIFFKIEVVLCENGGPKLKTMTVVAETVSRTLATFYFFNFLGFFGFGPFWSQIMGAMKKMETLVSVLIYQTLPKAQRTRGLSSYYKFLNKYGSYFNFRISIKH